MIDDDDPLGWRSETINGAVHVHPTRDDRPHRFGVDCECRPTVERYAKDLIIHNSFDGREFAEMQSGRSLGAREQRRDEMN
jgi:hypothetical protein